MARRCAVLLGGVLLFGLMAAPGVVAQESTDQQRIDDLGLSVVVGFDGQTRSGAWQPVSVGIEPARPVAGNLRLQSRTSSVSELVGIEVAAGSRKVYRFLAPPGAFDVTFSEEGSDPLTVRPPNAAPPNNYVVGLLGGGATNLPPLRSDITGQAGVWAPIDPLWLDLSPLAVDVVGTLVARASDLQGLSPRARSHLATAVATGTDLVVSGADVDDLPGLGLPWQVPAEPWRTSEATVVPAGHGRVVVTDVEPGSPGPGRSAELWSLLAQPGPSDTSNGGDYRVTAAPHQFARLLAESGSDVPALPGLGAFVAVYVLVVGPVNGLVLARRGRPELAWATIPLITVIFTGGAFLGATSARPPSGGAARLTYWVDGVASEFVAAGTRAPTPGNRTLTLAGDGWTVRPQLDGGRGATITRGTDTSVAMNLTALQLGGVAAWRTVDEPPPLEVTAVASSDGLDVEIRNTSGRTLDDVVVRAATAARSVASLAPGEQTTVTVGSASLPVSSAYRDPFEGLPLDQTGSVTPPLSMRAALNAEIATGRPGLVWVSAIDTGAAAPSVTTGDGRRVRDRGSMVAVGQPVQSGDHLSPFAIGRDAFVTGDPLRIGPEAIEGASEVYLRYRLPAGADPAQLTNQLERGDQSGGRPDLTIWERGRRQWIELDSAFFDRDRAPLVSPLGEVWVRSTGEMFPFEYSGRTVAGGGSP